MSVLSEVWSAQINAKFVDENNGVVRELTSYDRDVYKHKIHLLQGADLITGHKNLDLSNPTTVATKKKQTVTEKVIELDNYYTDATVVRDEDLYALPATVRNHFIDTHYQKLNAMIQEDAIVGIVPTSATNRITIKATGTGASGVKEVKIADIANMQSEFDGKNIPKAKRCVIIHNTHFKNLVTENITLYKEFSATGELFGFKVIRSNSILGFNKANGNTGTNDSIGSVFFQSDCVGRAMSGIKMFVKNDDPDTYGGEFNATVRFKSFLVRPEAVDCGVGVIYS